MIITTREQTVIILGTGDVNVVSIVSQEKHLLGMRNCEARPIGSSGDLRKGDVVSLDDYDVLIRFDRIESLDVVIDLLKQIKEDFKAERGDEE